MAVIASLVVDLEARTARLERDLARAQRANRTFARNTRRSYQALAGTLRTVGVAAAAAVAALTGGTILSIINAGDEIAKQARNVGFATEAYQRWQVALGLAGIGQQQFTVAATQVTRAIGEANNGLVSYQRAFTQLGLSYERLQDLNPEQQFEAVLRALENTEDATIRASSGAVLLGRAWREVGTVLSQGVDSVLGAATTLTPVTEMASVAAERFNDAWEFASTEIRNRLLNQLAPALEIVAANISRVVDITIAAANAISIAWNTVTATVRTVIAGINELYQLTLRGLRLLGAEVDEAIARNEAFEASLGAGVRRDLDQIVTQWGNITDAINGGTESAEQFIGASANAGQNVLDLAGATEETVSEVSNATEGLFDAVTEETMRWEDFTNRALDNLTDSFVDFFRTGRFNAREFANDLINEFLRIQLRSAIGGIFGGLFGGFRQEGGPVAAGQAYVVGEAGPELFVPGSSGTIIPNGEGGGGSTQVTYNINAVDARSFQQLLARDPQFIHNVSERGRRQQGGLSR